MQITPDNLTADEAAYVASYVERERRIRAFWVADYERKISKREGACMSGFDPTPVTMQTDEELTAEAIRSVMKLRVMTAREPFQVVLDIIGKRMADRDADCANLARTLTFAHGEYNHHLCAFAERLDAVAERYPDLIRDVADAKHCLDAMAMIAPREAA